VNLDPIARRVVHRYRRQILGSVRVEYSDAGNIDAIAIKKLLRSQFGYLYKLKFRRSDLRNTVLFDGLTVDDRLVHGRVVLHTTVRPDVLVSWGEVFIDSVDPVVADASLGVTA
jgi:hypothetical protein